MLILWLFLLKNVNYSILTVRNVAHIIKYSLFCSVLLNYYTMICIENLSFGYGKGKDLFSGFNMNLSGGIVCGLLGKNGVGKSTLLHIMSGLLLPYSGKVSYNGKSVGDRTPDVLSDMFLVPEEFSFPSVKLDKYLKIMAPFYPKFSYDNMNRYLEMFEVGRDCNLAKLSMGQKKKILISFALATNVTTLIMDEPTNGLDIPSKSQFRKVLSMFMNDERAVIISTHQIADVENLLDYVVILDYNRVLLNDSLGAVSSKLSFVHSSSVPEDAYYVQPSVNGVAAVVPASAGNETDVNLELLFNSIISVPKVAELFRKEA